MADATPDLEPTVELETGPVVDPMDAAIRFGIREVTDRVKLAPWPLDARIVQRELYRFCGRYPQFGFPGVFERLRTGSFKVYRLLLQCGPIFSRVITSGEAVFYALQDD